MQVFAYIEFVFNLQLRFLPNSLFVKVNTSHCTKFLIKILLIVPEIYLRTAILRCSKLEWLCF